MEWSKTSQGIILKEKLCHLNLAAENLTYIIDVIHLIDLFGLL